MSSPHSDPSPARPARFHHHSVGRLADLRENFPAVVFGPIDTAGVSAGKVFVGDNLKSSSFELSIHRMLPGQGIPFVHRHKRNEELYVILRGRGRFVLDGEELAVQEGDFIRVDPAAERTWAAAPDEELTYLCLQVEQGSLRGKTFSDGEIVSRVVPWRTDQ